LANTDNFSKSTNYANKYYIVRDFRRFDKKCFIDDLKEQLTVDHKVSTPSEIEDHFSKFVAVVLSWHKHVPWKQVFRKKRKLLQKPWITKGIWHKQKLYQTHYLNGSETQKQFYKKVC